MSGPSLARREAHHAIHQAAFDEAEQLTRLLRQAILARAPEHALPLVGALIEHWQSHTLQHAAAEEAGWYREVVAGQPGREADVIALTRDHELLRILLTEIQGILAQHDTLAGVLERFEAMLLVNTIHSREEEHRLLSSAEHDADQRPLGSPSHPAAPRPPFASSGEPVPLAVARPALYARLRTCLETTGVNLADLVAEVVRASDGPALRIRCGQSFAKIRTWPLPEVPEGITASYLDEVAAFCAVSAEEAYRQLMQLSP